MSKFIKVTDAKNGDISYHNASSITCFRDGEIWIGNEFADIVETAEQIEAQLLRDEFAMKALSSMDFTDIEYDDTVRIAYGTADAMLKERKK